METFADALFRRANIAVAAIMKDVELIMENGDPTTDVKAISKAVGDRVHWYRRWVLRNTENGDAQTNGRAT